MCRANSVPHRLQARQLSDQHEISQPHMALRMWVPAPPSAQHIAFLHAPYDCVSVHTSGTNVVSHGGLSSPGVQPHGGLSIRVCIDAVRVVEAGRETGRGIHHKTWRLDLPSKN
jgi:hypothetical protein